MSATDTASPCLDCGACCASFRVSFYWSEAEARGVPEGLTEQVNSWFGCMAGTNCAQPHCVALNGTIGQQVSCTIYTQRPHPCREVEAGDSQCNKARARHGMAPIEHPVVAPRPLFRKP